MSKGKLLSGRAVLVPRRDPKIVFLFSSAALCIASEVIRALYTFDSYIMAREVVINGVRLG